ncbi:MAG: exodeoxyribonuclease III [Acidobacteria bacterium]|nr:exodeoxyribonuclease III [Acidobacteriota bacterium]
MKIATWNVNSIAVRLPQALDWIKANLPDVLCLQEIKCTDDKFPLERFKELGYYAEIFGQPAYNGVAILSRTPASNTQKGFPDDAPDAQRRLLAANIGGVKVVNVYIPNGSEVGSEKFFYKLGWLKQLKTFFETHCAVQEPLVLCGDFNVAPEDRDVHDPILWYGKILCSPEERAALAEIAQWGLVDVFRQHHQERGLYSWWDYRGGGFRRNFGLRIDHLWATAPLAAKSVECVIDLAPRK